MSSAICFNLDPSEVLSSGNGLISLEMDFLSNHLVHEYCHNTIPLFDPHSFIAMEIQKLINIQSNFEN